MVRELTQQRCNVGLSQVGSDDPDHAGRRSHQGHRRWRRTWPIFVRLIYENPTAPMATLGFIKDCSSPLSVPKTPPRSIAEPALPNLHRRFPSLETVDWFLVVPLSSTRSDIFFRIVHYSWSPNSSPLFSSNFWGDWDRWIWRIFFSYVFNEIELNPFVWCNWYFSILKEKLISRDCIFV